MSDTFTFTLPTTGWGTLSYATRDGEEREGHPVTTIWGGCTSEEDAIAEFAEECRQLEGAPSDVLHEVQLVEHLGRDEARVIEERTIRGTGEPIGNDPDRIAITVHLLDGSIQPMTRGEYDQYGREYVRGVTRKGEMSDALRTRIAFREAGSV
jgi:hypothetical protein